VQGSRGLGKALSFTRPQSQPGAEAEARRPSRTLSATGASLLRGMPSQAKPREDPFSAVFQNDAQDPQRASEYAAGIFANFLDKEALFLPRSDYMEHQQDINPKMRAILIDWLVEVHLKYRLRHETLFLTVNIIDRYLSVRPVTRKKLQLLGCVAMLIAAKYEEIDPPKVHEFAYITDHTYSKPEIVKMESIVLLALEYQITVPTPVHLLDRLKRVNQCDAVHRALVEYVLELALMDVSFLRYPPSVLVGAALLMSNQFLGRRQVWSEALVHHTRHTEAALKGCASDLRVLLETAKTAEQKAVRRKYQLDAFYAVANMSPCWPAA